MNGCRKSDPFKGSFLLSLESDRIEQYILISFIRCNKFCTFTEPKY